MRALARFSDVDIVGFSQNLLFIFVKNHNAIYQSLYPFGFSTKNRITFLNSKDLRIKMWRHIKQNADEKGIFIDMINGFSDHCHCLLSVGSEQTIAKIAQMIKGESAHWINKNELTTEKFQWQDEYLAISVSESHIERVRNYIKNQESHHQETSFTEEYDKFVEHYGFKVEKF